MIDPPDLAARWLEEAKAPALQRWRDRGGHWLIHLRAAVAEHATDEDLDNLAVGTFDIDLAVSLAGALDDVDRDALRVLLLDVAGADGGTDSLRSWLVNRRVARFGHRGVWQSNVVSLRVLIAKKLALRCNDDELIRCPEEIELVREKARLSTPDINFVFRTIARTGWSPWRREIERTKPFYNVRGFRDAS